MKILYFILFFIAIIIGIIGMSVISNTINFWIKVLGFLIFAGGMSLGSFSLKHIRSKKKDKLDNKI